MIRIRSIVRTLLLHMSYRMVQTLEPFSLKIWQQIFRSSHGWAIRNLYKRLFVVWFDVVGNLKKIMLCSSHFHIQNFEQVPRVCSCVKSSAHVIASFLLTSSKFLILMNTVRNSLAYLLYFRRFHSSGSQSSLLCHSGIKKPAKIDPSDKCMLFSLV